LKWREMPFTSANSNPEISGNETIGKFLQACIMQLYLLFHFLIKNSFISALIYYCVFNPSLYYWQYLCSWNAVPSPALRVDTSLSFISYNAFRMSSSFHSSPLSVLGLYTFTIATLKNLILALQLVLDEWIPNLGLYISAGLLTAICNYELHDNRKCTTGLNPCYRWERIPTYWMETVECACLKTALTTASSSSSEAEGLEFDITEQERLRIHVRQECPMWLGAGHILNTGAPVLEASQFPKVHTCCWNFTMYFVAGMKKSLNYSCNFAYRANKMYFVIAGRTKTKFYL
jgi:hypothetical protein